MNPLSESNSCDSGNGSMDSPSWSPHGKFDALRTTVLTPLGPSEKEQGKRFIWGQEKVSMMQRFPKLDMSETPGAQRDTSGKSGRMSGNEARNPSMLAVSPAYGPLSSPKIIPFSSYERDTPPTPKSWASIVSGPKTSKNNTVIRPKAAPVLVIPKAPASQSPSRTLGPHPLSAGYAETAPSFAGRIRILQRSESDSFGGDQPEIDRKSFIPSYIQMQQAYSAQDRFSNTRQSDFPGQRRKASIAKMLGFSLPDRYEHLTPEEFVERLRVENKYNPGVLVLNFKNARFFVSRGHNQDDLLYSVAHNVWSTSDIGNQRLDTVYREQANLGPIYLFFSFHGSEQICGMAELLSGLESPDRTDLSSWDRWKAQFKIKWIFLKDVPMHLFEQVMVGLGNNKRSVLSARDCSEIPLQDAKQMAKLIQTYAHRTSLLDSFADRCSSVTEQRRMHQKKN